MRERETRSTEAEAAPRRRRRAETAGEAGMRLGISPSILDTERYEYRWINDNERARIHAKTQEDDWDIVRNDGSAKEETADLGNAISRIVGTHKDGSPMRAYLCRKPKTYFDDDQKAKAAILDGQLADLRRGNSASGESQSDYVPTSGIRIG